MPPAWRTLAPVTSTSVTPTSPSGADPKSWQVLDASAGNFVMSRFDSRGRLLIIADPGAALSEGDPISQLTLQNRTPNQNRQGSAAFPGIGGSAPGVTWLVDFGAVSAGAIGGPVGGVQYMWETAMDYQGYDFVPAYRRDPWLTGGGSGDIIRTLGVPYEPSTGFNSAVPLANVHSKSRDTPDRVVAGTMIKGGRSTPALMADVPAASTSWIVQWAKNGSAYGGVYNDGRVRIGTALGAPTPTYELDVIGTANADFFRLSNSTTAWQNTTAPRSYATSGTGAYPFNANGNLIAQPRSEVASASMDYIIATGQTPAPVIIAAGASNGGPNVALHGMLPTQLGGGKGNLGIGNTSVFPTGNPVNGGILSNSSAALSYIEPNGSRTAIGQNGPAGEPGIRVGVTRGLDTRFWRSAATEWSTDGDVVFSVGKGPVVRSPDGLVKKRIGIDNTGALTLTTVP